MVALSSLEIVLENKQTDSKINLYQQLSIQESCEVIEITYSLKVKFYK